MNFTRCLTCLLKVSVRRRKKSEFNTNLFIVSRPAAILLYIRESCGSISQWRLLSIFIFVFNHFIFIDVLYHGYGRKKSFFAHDPSDGDHASRGDYRPGVREHSILSSSSSSSTTTAAPPSPVQTSQVVVAGKRERASEEERAPERTNALQQSRI